MKTNKIFLMAFALLLSLTATAQNNIFEKYSDMRNVSSVYISKTMIEMQPDLYTRDLYIGKVAGQLDAVYVISTRDNNIKKDLRKDIEQYVHKGKYELLMKQKGTVSKSSFYVRKRGDKVQELVMISDGAASLKFVILTGNLTLKDIQNITNYQNTSNLIHLPADIYKTNIAKLKDLKCLEGFKELKNLKDLEKLNNPEIMKEIEKASEEIMKSIDLAEITGISL